jgi:elongation factor P--(R)-beta-lysine ligase
VTRHLRQRAQMLAQVRSFFAQRQVTEVDCPALSDSASIDLHIDLMPVQVAPGATRYLHSSPEYGMKRLLARGSGDIYQMSHVFRLGERSKRHTPEFTMIEWYRVGFSLAQLIEETVELLRLFVGPVAVQRTSYRQLFLDHLQIDPAHATDPELRQLLDQHNIVPHAGIELEGRDGLLNLLLGCLIEPRLPPEQLVVLSHYPASQAALARTHLDNGMQVAERFECYFGGLELANGYRELADPEEQLRRCHASNAERIAHGKEPLPIDQRFIDALHVGLPDCSGVAVGFDRLLQLQLGASSIDDVLPFCWEEA